MIQIGDRVVCVNDSFKPGLIKPNGLRKGNIYVIKDFFIKKCCKGIIVDIGLTTTSSIESFRCNNCDRSFIPPGHPTHWLSISRFRKVEPRKQIEYVRKEVEVDIEIEEPVLN